MIYLLDLNYTLVANSPKKGDEKISPFIKQIEQEEYREWLVDLLRPHQVILITARPEKYHEVTLKRIKAKTNWEPMAAFFNEIKAPPPVTKKHALETHIFPTYGKEGYFAFESNPQTRAMYNKHGIPSVYVADEAKISKNAVNSLIST